MQNIYKQWNEHFNPILNKPRLNKREQKIISIPEADIMKEIHLLDTTSMPLTQPPQKIEDI